MARIVQDSDDELEEDLEADLQLPPPKQLNASGDPSGTAQHTRPHFQPSQDEPPSSVSLPEHPNKKRKAESRQSPCISPPNGSAKKKEPITYGQNPKLIFSSSPVFNAPGRDHSVGHAVNDRLAPAHDAIWNFEGTMRDHYARHEPAMFPEPSSTVPNATMTQQRVLDVVNAVTMLGQESDMGGPCYYAPPEPSVPWSDLMKFTPADATEQTESLDCDLPPGFPFSTPLMTPQDDTGLPRHDESRSSKTSSHQQKSQSTPTSDGELTVIGMPQEQYKPRPSRSRSLKMDTEEPIDHSVRPERARKISKRRRTTAELDAASTTTPEKVRQICDMGFTPSTTAGALQRNNGDVIRTIDWLVINNIGHDELAPQSPPISKPKPQEGRETPAMDPETVQDIMRNLNEYRQEEETAQGAQPAMADADGPLTKTESANSTMTTSDTRVRSEIVQNMSPTKVQVVIPKKSPKVVATQATDTMSAPTTKAKRRESTLDQPEPEPITWTCASTEVKAEKKGRGRRKKTATTTAPIEPIKDLSEHGAKEEQPRVVQQITQLESATENAESNTEEAPEKVKSENSARHPNLPSKTCPAAASETPERWTKLMTDLPMNKAKVPYRVGLSKRARIAPLLRTLKK